MAEQDADYAVKIMNQIKLYGKPIRVNKASYDQKKPIDIGANLFIGSLDESVEEGQMYETFQTFGSLVEQPKVSSSLSKI
jgi:splicing factor 3B subunit 4